jgi:hypothetical protein
MRLQKGEKAKFERKDGGSNETTQQTLSADEIIGDILTQNMGFIPIAISPWGTCGSIFNRFLYGEGASSQPKINKNKPNAQKAARLSLSDTMPKGILPRAGKLWQEHHPNEFFGFSYMSPNPKIWAEQQIGLTIASALSNHILVAYNKVKILPVRECNCAEKYFDESVSHIETDLSSPFPVPPSPAHGQSKGCISCCPAPKRKSKGRSASKRKLKGGQTKPTPILQPPVETCTINR